MKKNKTKKLTLSRETVFQLDDVLQSIAGGCNNNSDCPECPKERPRTNSCFVCNGGDQDYN